MIVIEHHQAVMAHADWIIDLGPGAGHDGGTVVFEGTPADLVAARSTLTGEHLAALRRRLNHPPGRVVRHPPPSERKRAMAETKKGTTSEGFSAEERAAMKERAKETRRKKSGSGEADLLEKIAEMGDADRAMAERIHAVITEAAPDL